MGALSIRFVSNVAELRQVGRFRHAVYVEEMHRHRDRPDGDRLLIDPMDDGAYIIAAWDGTAVVGTVRISLCGSAGIGAYEDWYRAPEVAGSAWPSRTALLTRLMVAPEFRRTTLSARLCGACFSFGVARGVTCALMDCNEHLLPYFARIGWILQGSFDHPDYGRVFTHSFDLADVGRLRGLRSPLLRAAAGADSGGAAIVTTSAMVAACMERSAPKRAAHVPPSRKGGRIAA
ncbi:GNAT family N-acetyltransferase [Allosphingosinicella sp.]|uniref:GNAT family N-acetyltransferase n=1 Tax=Allosphingosinicella sp. TaxID=2823234 RepID=UPI0037849F40